MRRSIPCPQIKPFVRRIAGSLARLVQCFPNEHLRDQDLAGHIRVNDAIALIARTR